MNECTTVYASHIKQVQYMHPHDAVYSVVYNILVLLIVRVQVTQLIIIDTPGLHCHIFRDKNGWRGKI